MRSREGVSLAFTHRLWHGCWNVQVTAYNYRFVSLLPTRGWHLIIVDEYYELLISAECDIEEIINITNGILLTDQVSYHMGDSIDFQCDSGYTKSSQQDIMCLSNATWSAQPSCGKLRYLTQYLKNPKECLYPCASYQNWSQSLRLCVVL